MNLSKIRLVEQVARAAFVAGLLLVVSAGRTLESGGVEVRDLLEDESHSRQPAECYTRLYESIMIRQGPDGKSYGADELDPLLWRASKFLLEGESHESLIAALDAFAAQASRKFEIYTAVQRAVMQRLLWAVFDWTADRGGKVSERKRAIQQKLVPIVRRLSLSREAINALDDNFLPQRSRPIATVGIPTRKPFSSRFFPPPFPSQRDPGFA